MARWTKNENAGLMNSSYAPGRYADIDGLSLGKAITFIKLDNPL